MKRKIFEKQIIDMETGEITSVTTVTASKFAESFSMCRTTSGIEWLFELTGNEIKTLIFLLELEREKTKKVVFGANDRKDLAEILGCSLASVSRVLKHLEDKGYLIRLNNQELVLNPKGFYKGSSKDVLPRIQEFERVFASRKSEATSPTERSDFTSEVKTKDEEGLQHATN